jgi:hypothetical protein
MQLIAWSITHTIHYYCVADAGSVIQLYLFILKVITRVFNLAAALLLKNTNLPRHWYIESSQNYSKYWIQGKRTRRICAAAAACRE